MISIEGFVLAGGLSRRMGRNKASLLLGGKTLIERAALSLESVSGTRIYIVGECANNNLNLPAVADLSDKKIRGSIIGLYTALSNAKSELAAIIACDLPFVPGELFAQLVSLATEDYDAIVPLQPDGMPQPLCALYRPKTCLPHLEEMRALGIWKVRELLSRVATRFVEFDTLSDLPGADQMFFNVNTPEDYAEAVLKNSTSEIRP